MVLAAWITRQLVFNGIVTGLVIGMLAMGVVLIFRSTRVINFAVGNLGLPAAALLALMKINWGFPFWVALGLALAMGTAIGAIVELTVVRRLFTRPRVILLVATVGVAQLMRAVTASLPDIEGAGQRFPVVASSTWSDVWPLGLRITGPQVTILVVVPIVAIALGWTLNRTVFGRAVAASASNPDLARLSGVNPKIVSTFVWIVAGLLSSLSIILLSGQSGNMSGLENLGPLTLARALAAASIAGMMSFPRAVAAGVLIGVTESVVRFNFLAEAGLVDFLLFLAVLAAVYVQSRGRSDDSILAFVPKVKPIPAHLVQIWWVRAMPRLALGAAFAFALVLPLIVELPSRHLLYATVLGTAICALSVTVITGWSGQLSLSQMAFAGIGALLAAALSRGVELDIGWREWRVLDFEAPGLPFLASILLAALLTAMLAAVIGAGALRVRGLMLAVSTFAFSIAATQYLFKRPLLSGGSSSGVPFQRGSVFGLELTTQRAYYYFMLACLAIAFVLVSRLRDSGVGRSTIAVRDNSAAAAAYTVNPTRAKLTAFALAGGLAGLGGALLGGLVQNIRFAETLFTVQDSLRLVGIAVIGGLGSVTGAVLGAAWVVGLPSFFPDNDLVPLFTSSIGLLVIIMYIPGGFIQAAYAARDALLGWFDQRTQTATAAVVQPGTRSDAAHEPMPRTAAGAGSAPMPRASSGAGSAPMPRTAAGAGRDSVARLAGSAEAQPTPSVMLDARNMSVRFGGNIAVRDVSLQVRRDEIVGLIGTNGAGKSTLMNAVGGFVSAEGTVSILGSDMTRRSAPQRARAGLGRTFQAATLFPELTVTETVMVALEAQGRTPFVATSLHLPHTVRNERARRANAVELIDWLGLGDHASHYISDLSTGTKRVVELACLLALSARVLCLDEPTAGVAQRETEAFAPILRRIRDELSACILLIEHDMNVIMGVSDRVYCLEAGTVIAEGTPEQVRDNPKVISSYLGSDQPV